MVDCDDAARHQPPDPHDLERHPARSPVCQRVRGLVRDYADGELDEALLRVVDLHVHSCRACSLALARAEHEVLRLRRAATEVATAAPAGFAARTVQRLVRELSRTPSEVTMVSRSPVPRGLPTRYLVGGLLIAAAALLLSVLLVVTAGGELEGRSRLAVLQSVHAFWNTGNDTGPLKVGGFVPDGATVTVAEGGGAVLAWRPDATGRTGSAKIDLHQGARLGMVDGVPNLAAGVAQLEVSRPTEFRVADGSRVEFETGRFHLEAAAFRSFDDVLDGRSGSLRVRIEVLSGEGARIHRGAEGAAALVSEGQVAAWEGWTPITIEAAPDPAAMIGPSSTAARSPTPATPLPPGLVGSVFERPTGSPSHGARVMVLFGSGGNSASWSGDTDALGVFRLPSDLAVDGGFVVAQLFPPPGRVDLGVPAPQVVPVVRPPQGARLAQALALEPGAQVRGSVTDPDQRPVVGARVVPCLIDELFGCLLPWLEGAAWTDQRGGFALQGLSRSLPPYVRVGLLVLHPAYASYCQPVPTPGSLAAVEFRWQFTMEPVLSATVAGLPPGQTVEVLEELPGLAPGTGARVHRVQTNAAGQAAGTLRIGRGTLWARVGPVGRPMLRRLHQVELPQGKIWQPAALPAEEWSGVFRPLVPVPGSDFLLNRSFRGERFAVGRGGPTSVGLISDLSGRPVPGAELFGFAPGAQRNGEQARLLGVEDGGGSLAVQLGGLEELLLGLSADGSIGLAAAAGAANHLVTLLEPGVLVLGEACRPQPQDPQQTVALRLLRRGSSLVETAPELVRFVCGAEGWQARGVPPGEYDITGPGNRNWTIQVQAGQVHPLR